MQSYIVDISQPFYNVFNHFLRIDATDRSKISSDQYRIQFDISLFQGDDSSLPVYSLTTVH